LGISGAKFSQDRGLSCHPTIQQYQSTSGKIGAMPKRANKYINNSVI